VCSCGGGRGGGGAVRRERGRKGGGGGGGIAIKEVLTAKNSSDPCTIPE